MLRQVGVTITAALLCGAAMPQDAATPTTSAAATAQLPTEAFAEIPPVVRPVLSPGGTRFATQATIGGVRYLAVGTVGGGRKLIALGDNDLNWWRWVNDDWLVAGVGQEMRVQGEPWYVSRAVGIDVATGDFKMLTGSDAAQNADDVIWVARDGSARVMIAYQTSIYPTESGFWPRVVQIDLATGRRTSMQAPRTGVFNWYADGDGVIRMGVGVGDNGRSRRLLYRATADAPFRVVDRATRKEGKLTVPVMFLRDKSKALVIDDDDTGFSAFYEFNLDTLERGKQLFATKGYDIAGLVASADGFDYLGVRTEENRPEIRWLDPEMVAMHESVAAMVKGARTELVSVSRDRNRAIVRIGGADSPGAWYLHDRKLGELAMISQDNSTIKMRRLHPVRTIRYKARDGLEIPAVLTLPRGKSVNLPLIVMPHGGPFARDSETWDWWTQFLADRGYAVIQPNYRGSSGYGTEFTRKGEGQWGLAMQDDLNDAIKALADQGIADPKRVCMVGASYGGYAAMRAAQRDGAIYRCAVSYAGVSDLNRMVAQQRDFLNFGSRIDWLREQAPDLKGVSPINFPEQVSIPLLLMHGEKDRVVPVVHSRAMAQKLKSAGKDVTYIAQKQGDHYFSRGEDRLEFLKALEAFLAKHNPA